MKCWTVLISDGSSDCKSMRKYLHAETDLMMQKVCNVLYAGSLSLRSFFTAIIDGQLVSVLNSLFVLPIEQ